LPKKIEFIVYGKPVAQGRPRATTINGRIKMYDPKKSSEYKNYIRLVASQHAPKELLDGPLQLTVRVYRPTLKSFSKKKKKLAEEGKIRPTTKPDTDNYIKGIKDALKNVIWKDDSQVVDLQVSKFYSEKPRIEVKIEQIG